MRRAVRHFRRSNPTDKDQYEKSMRDCSLRKTECFPPPQGSCASNILQWSDTGISWTVPPPFGSTSNPSCPLWRSRAELDSVRHPSSLAGPNDIPQRKRPQRHRAFVSGPVGDLHLLWRLVGSWCPDAINHLPDCKGSLRLLERRDGRCGARIPPFRPPHGKPVYSTIRIR